MIEIDGSYGEGGGSIVRLACAFSAVTERAFKIFNIRARRKPPGLKAQHLTAVKAVAKLCDAKLKSGELNSKEIEFSPGKISGGSLNLDVGTAGSITLVLQALMLPALHCEKPLDIKIKGGTFVRWSPSVGYLQNITMPLLGKLSYKGKIILHKHGFYPKGGGLVEARIWPSLLKGLTLTERGKLIEVKGECIASQGLAKAKVAERMRKTVVKKIFKEFNTEAVISCSYVDVFGEGAGINLYALYENSVLGASQVGERGKSSEDVAEEAFNDLIKQHRSNAPLDEHITDQILPYLALAEGSSRVKAVRITEHAKTNIWLLKKFIKRDIVIKGKVIELK